jgi:hypothetical protein
MAELLGYWPLDTTNFYDRGYNNHGTFEGTSTTKTFIKGVDDTDKAIDFDGVDQRLDVGTATPLDKFGNGDCSVSFWMKSSATINSNGRMVSRYQVTNDEFRITSNGTSNQIQLYIESGASTATINFSTSSAAFDQKWHFIVVVLNRTTNKAYLYMDTIKDSVEGDISTLPSDLSTSGNWAFGARADNGSNPYDGAIDEVRLYKGMLTREEILFLYFNPKGKAVNEMSFELLDNTLNDIILDAPCQMGLGDTAYDRTGNQNNGDLDVGVSWSNALSQATADLKSVQGDGTADTSVDFGNTTAPIGDLGDGSFSISFWMRHDTGASTITERVVSKFEDGSNNIMLLKASTTSTDFRIQLSFDSGASTLTVNTAYDGPYNQNWHHVVCVVDRTNDIAYFYIDNIKDVNTGDTSSHPADCTNTGDLVALNRAVSDTSPFDGKFTFLKIFKRVLSRTEINFLYRYPDGKPFLTDIDISTNLIGYWPFNEGTGLVTTEDYSGYGNDGTFTGTWIAADWERSFINTSCLRFYGSSATSYIVITDSDPIDDLGNGSFSISFWMRAKDTVPLTFGNIISKVLDADNRIIIRSNGTSQNISFEIAKSGTSVDTVFNSTVFTTGYNHVVIIADRATDKALMYVNGVLDSVEGDLSTLPDDCSNTSNLSFGARNDGVSPYEGLIDEIRIYNTTLTTDQIEYLFERPQLPTPPSRAFGSPDGLEIRMLSPTGGLIGILSDQTGAGNILDARLTVLKNGGLDTFTFRISRSVDIPITINTQCEFYINGEKKFIGAIREEPQADQDLPVLIVNGVGFMHDLLKTDSSEDYTGENLTFIVTDIAENKFNNTNLRPNFNPYKLNQLPNLTNITIDFDDTTIWNIMKWVLDLANYDYANEKFRMYVNEDRDFVMEPMSTDPITNLFEGYDYQNPETNIDRTKIINLIRNYRTTSADSRDTEFVANDLDAESQGRYGISFIKQIYPYYVDSTTIDNVAKFLLSRWKDPQINIRVQNLEFINNDVYDFGDYYMSNRRELFWRIIADCDTLTGWNTTNFIDTTVTADAMVRVLTGRRSLKFTTKTGSATEYIEFTLADKIALPQKLRLYLYVLEGEPDITITFYDDQSNSYTINIDASTDQIQRQWYRKEETIGLTTETDTALVNTDAVTTDDLDVNIDATTVDTLEFRREVSAGLLLVNKVRITINNNDASVFYIDRIDTFADIYSFYKLQLEQVNYQLDSKGFIAELSLGNKIDSVIDEIQGKVDENNIALQIFAKPN